MHKAIARMLLPLMAVVMLFIVSAPAHAADTWQPRFDKNTHVYLDPRLANHPANPVNLDGLEQQLVQAGKKHNLQIFFIMVEKGTESCPQGTPFAVCKIDQVVGNWMGQPGFPTDNYLIILNVRLDTDWTKTSRAANSGTALRAHGVEGQTLLRMLDNNASLLPTNPKGYAVGVAAAVNAQIDAHIAQVERDRQKAIDDAEAERLRKIREAEEAKQREIDNARRAEESAKFWASARHNALIFGPPLLFLILLGLRFIFFRKNRDAAAAVIAKWKTDFDAAHTNYLALDKAYLRFLTAQEQDNRRKNFRGRTKTEYEAAVGNYGALSARVEGAQTRLAEAEKAFASGSMLSFGGFQRAIALLTSDAEDHKVKITGETLPLEKRTLFGSSVKEDTYSPNALIANMDSLFQQITAALSGIVSAFAATEQNKQDIEGLVASIEESKKALTENGLVFDPYTQTLTDLCAQRDAFVKILNSDPLEALDDSEAVERGVEALKKTIDLAIEQKKDLARTEKSIATAAKKVTDTRAQVADYKYPEQVQAQSGLPANTLLKEDAADPDKPLAQAREFYAQALHHVIAGNLEASEKAQTQAEQKASETSALVDTILAARKFVQEQVTVVRGNLGRLFNELPGGNDDVAALNAGFLKKNFDGQPAKVTAAQAVHDRTEAELAKVRIAFFEQRYVASRALLEKIGADIQGARNGIVEVHTRLKQLEDDRKNAKAAVDRSEDLEKALVTKLAGNAHTTSARTDEAFKLLQPAVKRARTDVDQAITDWPAAKATADKLEADLKGIDTKIDEEKQAHQNAGRRISELQTVCSTAESELNHRFTRKEARGKLTEANSVLEQVQREIKVAKSDWNAIARKAEGGKTAAEDARTKARTDRENGTAAEAAISRASQKISGVSGRSYQESKSIGGSHRSFGGNVRANTSSAASQLASAESALHNKDYETAKRNADAAYQAAERAEDAAERETAALIAAAVAIWEAEERRRREEEERRRRQEEEERRRRQQQEDDDRRRREESSRSSSSNNDFGGSSGSTGSSFSGSSGSVGGGDF